jgi:RsiW-degrading membrane proteinase PrsW (M82 family)
VRLSARLPDLMALVVLGAHLYGAFQVFLLGTYARTVRWRAVPVAFAAGAYACTAVAGLLQLGWIVPVAALLGMPVRELTAVASYTVDPFLEELVKVAPLGLALLAMRDRRALRVTDLVVLGGAIGAGFALTELLFHQADAMHSGVWTGEQWLLPQSLSPPAIPAPGVILRSFIPHGVTIGRLIDLNAPLAVPDVHLSWTVLGGLSVGLLARATRARDRVLAMVPLLLAGADHALYNGLAQLAGIDPSGWPVRYLYPLAALGVALRADREAGLPGPRWHVPRLRAPHVTVTPASALMLVPAVPPLLYFGLATLPGSTGFAAALTSVPVFWLIVVLLIAGLAWTVVAGVRSLRLLPATLRGGAGEAVTLHVLGLATAAGGVLAGALALYGALAGGGPDGPLLRAAHLSDALFAAALIVALAFAIAAVPVTLVSLSVVGGLVVAGGIARAVESGAIGGDDGGAATPAAGGGVTAGGTTVEDYLGGTTPGRERKVEQRHKPGGIEEANEDFDELAEGHEVTDQGNGVRSTRLPDGTTISVREHSSEGSPTIQINRPGRKPVKVRYGR